MKRWEKADTYRLMGICRSVKFRMFVSKILYIVVCGLLQEKKSMYANIY